MKGSISKIIMIAVLLLITVKSRSQEVVSSVTPVQYAFIAQQMAPFPEGSQVAFAFIKHDSLYYAGFIRKGDTIVPVTNNDSVFEIGSITKVFTSALLCEINKDGAVDINAPFSKYLDVVPNVPKNAGDKMTLLTLSNHTSGLEKLPDDIFKTENFKDENPYIDYHEAELLAYIEKKMKIKGTPGTKYEYSNMGAGILGYTLERTTGLSYEHLLEERICSKIDLRSTTTDRSKIQSMLVSGRDKDGKIIQNWDFDVLEGAGAIKSSVKDLAKFVYANYSGLGSFRTQQQKTFKINDQMDIAMGWHIIHTKGGENWHWHNGGTGGYSSSLAMDLDKHNAVIMLTNISAFHPSNGNVDQLCFMLMSTLR